MASVENIERLIFKHFDGLLNSEETAILNVWKSKTKNQLIFDQYQQIWKISRNLEDWKDYDTTKALEIHNKRTPEYSNRKWILPILKIAAIGMLLLSAGYFVFISDYSFVSNPDNPASFTRTFLEDGTEVVLSEGSELIVSPEFNIEERRIQLTGEAFFNVVPHSSKKFIIELEGTLIEVVGTSFLANSKDNSVFVNEGIVILRDKKNPESKLSLFAGESASFKAEKLSPIDFDVEWLQGEITLANRSVKELMCDLQKIFPESLQYSPEGIADDCKITTKFNNNSLLEVVNELDLIFDVEYTHTQNFIHILSINCE